jgi:cytochrome bd-type quinol oxidase subunit 2
MIMVLPSFVYAQTTGVPEIIGLFNIVVGFMFVCACLLFGGGLISYGVNFGNAERMQGIKLMEWGVATLFVLIVLLGVVQFLQGHGGVANVIVAFIIMMIIVGGALSAFTQESVSKKTEKKP